MRGANIMFELDPRLAADTVVVGRTPLSRLLLMNDARYPWLILVPERDGMVEAFDLPESEQRQLWQEAMAIGAWMKSHFGADKFNVAALGNQVAQLHLHLIARFHSDPAWPGPVWGVGTPASYSEQSLASMLHTLRQGLAAHLSLEVGDD
jgi:diadenosine tetraphosphate (Ap4A) HIT family hydrolase